MLLIALKVLLAPVAVAIASTLARRLGPQRGGFFIGLPATSLPFLVVVCLASGQAAAGRAAAGSLSGQLICALFTIAYSRIAPRLGAAASTLASIAVAAGIGLSTLGLHRHLLLLLLVLLAATAGLATWPAARATAGLATSRRLDIPLRMLMAGLTVFTLASVEPHLGGLLAGALSSLPLILLVMTPSVHASQGPAVAVDLARGTLCSIPGTAALMCAITLATPVVGFWLAMLIGLAVLPVVNALVARVSGRLAARRPSAAHPRWALS